MKTIRRYFVLKGDICEKRNVSSLIYLMTDSRCSVAFAHKKSITLMTDYTLSVYLGGTKLFNDGKQSSHKHHSCIYPIIKKETGRFPNAQLQPCSGMLQGQIGAQFTAQVSSNHRWIHQWHLQGSHWTSYRFPAAALNEQPQLAHHIKHVGGIGISLYGRTWQ